MSLISKKCLSCGEETLIADQREFGFCSFCGSKIINNNQSANTSDELEKFLKNAEILYQLGDIERATVILNNVTNDYPSDYRAWLKLEEYFIYETSKPFYNVIKEIKEKGAEFLFSELFEASHYHVGINATSIFMNLNIVSKYGIERDNHQNFKSMLILAPRNEVERIRNEYKILNNLIIEFLSLEKETLKKSRISMSETINIFEKLDQKFGPLYEKYLKIQSRNKTSFFRKKQVEMPSREKLLEEELANAIINKTTYDFYEKYIIGMISQKPDRVSSAAYLEKACRACLTMIDNKIKEIDESMAEHLN